MTQPADPPCPINPDAAALALHALEPEEEIAVRTHLPHCPSCQETVRATELAMAELGSSVPQLDPPARLRASILAAAAATPQEAPDDTPQLQGQDGSLPRPGARREPASRPAGRDASAARPSSTRNRRRIVALVLAAAVVLGFGGVTAYAVQARQERDAQIAQTQALAELLARVAQPGTTRATLNTPAGQTVAVVVASPGGATVVAAGLAPNAADHSTYVLWGIDGKGSHAVAAFDVVPSTAAYPLAGVGSAYSAYAISLEPGRTMPAVATTVVASGPAQT
ncbi:anti-sigma factor domain-containing protein [Pseudonocardia sp. CA-107938]|uniref:anti-sigma factor n=1 Tax=Pseudonocardia sp. CA-107938 TaxID=3240021 RepID=UPI003D8E1054